MKFKDLAKGIKYEAELITLAALAHPAKKKIHTRSGRKRGTTKRFTGTEFNRFCAMLFRGLADIFIDNGKLELYGIGTLIPMEIDLYNNPFNLKLLGPPRLETKIKTPILLNRSTKFKYFYIRKNLNLKKRTKRMML